MAVRRRNRGRGPQRARLHRPQAAATSTATEVRAAAGPKRKTILVVEDNATVGGLLVALFREEGYRTLRAWDVREAVKIARDRKPDLLLLELSLPYRDGLEMLGELRAHPETKDAPIVIVSGNVLQLLPAEQEMLADNISKPIDIDRLVNRVRLAIGDPELEIPEKNYNSTVDYNMHTW